MTPSPIAFRPYQVEAQSNVATDFLERKEFRLLGVLPMGCGKTRIFAEQNREERMAKWIATFPTTHQKMLVIAHRDELITQAKDKVAEVNTGLIVEIEQADNWASPMADIIVASIQTLASRSGKRLMRIDPEAVRIIVIDEAHHATAESYTKVLQYFNILPPDSFMFESRPPRVKVAATLAWQRARLAAWDDIVRLNGQPQTLLFGLTATPKRGDDVGLEAVFSKIAFFRDIRQMIEEGWLCRLRGRRVKSEVSLDAVHSKGGDFNEKELAKTVNLASRNQLAVKAYLDHAADRSAVVFCVDVAHATAMAETFLRADISAAVIHGGLKKDDRKELLKKFHLGEIRVLTNCQVLTEGWDEPVVGCIIHAAPTKSGLLYAQRTGRGTRLWNTSVKGFFGVEKEDCLVIDLVDLTKKHSLATVADLFGLPPKFDVKGEDLVAVVKQVETMRAEHPHLSLGDCESLDDIQMRTEDVDLFDLTASALQPVVKESAELSWIHAADDHYQLKYAGENFPEVIDIRRNPVSGKWGIALSRGFRSEERLMPAQADLPSAFKAAEQWVSSHQPKAFSITKQTAPWRTSAVTDAQIARLKKFDLKVNWRSLNRGQVQDLLEYHAAKVATRHEIQLSKTA